MKTIQEIISDPEFYKFVSESISEWIDIRIKRPRAPIGFYYKRDWFDKMSESGRLNTRYFVDNIGSIWNKQSNLPSNERAVILAICNNAAFKMVSKDTQSV